MRVLVVGAGMYVTGRGTDGLGTILPALAQCSKTLPVEGVTVVARRPENGPIVRAAAERVNAALSTRLVFEYSERFDDLPGLARDCGATAAIVSIPDHLHHGAASALLDSGMHVLVVKPLTPTLAEARALTNQARARRLHGAVELHKRWDESNLYARRAVRRGVLGRPVSMNVAYSQRISIPLDHFRAWSERTHIFQYLGVHYVDLVYFVTSYHPVRVSALGARGALAERGLTGFDSVHATVTWRAPEETQESLVTQFAVGWIDPVTSTAMSDQRYSIVGTLGRLDLDQKHRGVELVTESGGARSVNPYFCELLPDIDGGETFRGYGFESIRQFVSDVARLGDGRATLDDLRGLRPTFEDALRSTAVIEAASRSMARAGEWELIDDLAVCQ